jgi:hypothetical protein
MITMILGGLWHGASWTFIIWGCLHGAYLCVNHFWIYIKKTVGMRGDSTFVTRALACALTFISVVVAWVFFRSPDFATAYQIIHAMFLGFTSSVAMGSLSFKFIVLITIAATITWLTPNTYQLLARYKPALTPFKDYTLVKSKFMWKPILIWNTAMAMMFVIDIMFIQASSVFLYFRF